MTPEQKATLKDIGERVNYARGVHSQDRLAQMLLIDREALYDLLLDTLHDLEEAREERDTARDHARSMLRDIQSKDGYNLDKWGKPYNLPWVKDA